jgi:hypothetical protein
MSTHPSRSLRGPSKLVTRQGTRVLIRATSRSLAKNVKQQSVLGRGATSGIQFQDAAFFVAVRRCTGLAAIARKISTWFMGTQWQRVESRVPPRGNRATCFVSTMRVRRFDRTFFGGTFQPRSYRLDGAAAIQLSSTALWTLQFTIASEALCRRYSRLSGTRRGLANRSTEREVTRFNNFRSA